VLSHRPRGHNPFTVGHESDGIQFLWSVGVAGKYNVNDFTIGDDGSGGTTVSAYLTPSNSTADFVVAVCTR